MTPSKVISDDIFVAFLQCKHKAYLKLTRAAGEQGDYERLQLLLTEEHRRRAAASLGAAGDFDEELKQLARDFTILLQAVVETIDRFGLKRLHLAKHQKEVERFYARLSQAEYRSEIAAYYQQRLTKYKDKLFTFLGRDGIPWNNNNGENAIKRFAALRKVLGTAFTEEGIKDYMVLLSICQTLRYRGGNFWRFLLSRETDLDAFLMRNRRGS